MPACNLCVDEGKIEKPLTLRWLGVRLFWGAFGIFFGGVYLLFFPPKERLFLGDLLIIILLIFYVLVAGWRFWRFIRLNVIGRTLYLFLDQHDRFHIHNTTHDLFPGTLRSYIKGTYFQVRIGGWFRKNRVCNDQHQHWKIVHCWGDIRTICLRDNWGVEISGLDFDAGAGAISAQQLLKMVNTYSAVMYVFKKVEQLEKHREQVGRTLVRLIEEIRRSKETMGRSKHAQKLREQLVELSHYFPDELVNRWYHEIEQEQTQIVNGG